MILLDGVWRPVDVTYETDVFLFDGSFVDRVILSGDFNTPKSKIDQIKGSCGVYKK